MEQVTSRDGTPIAFYRSGTGSPLVLVPGTGAANPRSWTAALPALEQHFSIYALERRGRGESGDGPTYALEREFEDIAAVVAAAGAPAYVLGHSFGGLCALGATLVTAQIRKLILYEPGIRLPSDEVNDSQEVNDRIQALLAAGEREAVVTLFYREVAKLSPDDIDKLRASPAWPARVAAAHTISREIQAYDGYLFDSQRFRDLHTPTMLLLGGDSPDSEKQIATVVAAALPNSRIVEMPGQQHIAMHTAPDLFVHEVVKFLNEPL